MLMLKDLEEIKKLTESLLETGKKLNNEPHGPYTITDRTMFSVRCKYLQKRINMLISAQSTAPVLKKGERPAFNFMTQLRKKRVVQC